MIQTLIPITTERDRTDEKKLCLAYQIGAGGSLERRYLPYQTQGCLIGISDLTALHAPAHPERFARAMLDEARKYGYTGVFLDVEQNKQALEEIVQNCDQLCFSQHFPMYVPAECADLTEHAICVAETAISGGSLSKRFSSLCQSLGVERVAAFLRPISVDFTLPSATNYGIPIENEAREALLERIHAQCYFSKELCAKYFTYTDGASSAHFILFDDESTMQEKRRQLADLGIRDLFVLFRHWHLLNG